MVDTHCHTKPVTRAKPAMIDSSLNNQDATYMSKSRLPAVDQVHDKSEDNKKTHAKRLNAQSVTRGNRVIEKKIGSFYRIRFAKNADKTMALIQNLVICLTVYIGCCLLRQHSIEFPPAVFDVFVVF